MASNSLVCPGGLVCPAGYQCDVSAATNEERCLTPEQLAVCAGVADGADCALADGLPGTCIDGACELHRCGDNRATFGEECDGSDIRDTFCTDLGYYGPEQPTCSSLCSFVETGCSGGKCGDGEINGPEICDGPSTKSCIALGYDAGTARCGTNCGFTVHDCSKFGWDPESLDVVALGVAASSDTDQWAVGTHGKVLRSDGAVWSAVDSGVPNDLKAVWAVGPYAWIVGLPVDNPAAPGVVLFWDGNQTTPSWTKIDGAPAAFYNDVWAVDPMAVYVATQELGVQVYNGTTWARLGDLTGEVYAIRGTSPTDIWAATEPGLQHWNGTTWTMAALGDTRIRFIDANAPDDVWVAGEARSNIGTGVVAHWNGSTWTAQRTPQEIYNGISSSAPNDAWLVVSGELRHFDGVAWSTAAISGGSPMAVSGIHSIDANHVLLVSTLRVAYRYRGATFGAFREQRLFPESNPWTSDTNTDLLSFAANELFVTNVKGQVLRFDGTKWTVMFTIPRVQPEDAIPANALWGPDRNNLFVAGGNGSVYRWNGATWATHELSPTIPIDEIWGVTATNVWAFGAGGAWRWDGSQWTRSTLSNKQVLSASGAGTEFYAVEEGEPHNKLWHFSAGMWRDITAETATTTKLSAVIVVDPNNVHVAARMGHILTYDGSTWRDERVAAVAELRYFGASGPRDVVVASERELFSFDGISWSPMRTPVELVPNTPDYFPIAGLVASPARLDILMERWRVRNVLRTRPLTCDTREVCGDNVDNNCDGLIDSTDPQCP